jgi:hypothetical protein
MASEIGLNLLFSAENSFKILTYQRLYSGQQLQLLKCSRLHLNLITKFVAAMLQLQISHKTVVGTIGLLVAFWFICSMKNQMGGT